MTITILQTNREKEINLSLATKKEVEYSIKKGFDYTIDSQDIIEDYSDFEGMPLDELFNFVEKYNSLEKEDVLKLKFMVNNGYSTVAEVLADIESVVIFKDKNLSQVLTEVVEEQVGENQFIIDIIDYNKGEEALKSSGYEAYGNDTFRREL